MYLTSRSLRSSTAVLRCAIVLLFSGVVACGAAIEPFPGLDAKWRHGRSEHFEIYARSSESYAREILRNLETMRSAFLKTHELAADDCTDVSIYVFRSRSDMRAYASPHFASNEDLIGEYRPGLDRDVILLDAASPPETAYWVVYADLTRNLLHGAGSRGPSWLHQGLSMLWGNFDARGRRNVAGQPDRLREELVRDNPGMDLAALFAVQEGAAALPDFKQARDEAQKTTNIFHAKAWVLLHYWYFGQQEVPVSDVNRFVQFMLLSRRADEPESVRAEFEKIFKVDYAEMNRRVSRYMRAGRFHSRTIENIEAPAAASFALRPVDAPEMHERLAELRVRTRRDELGKFVLLDALRRPRAARAAEALGTMAAGESDETQAQDYWRRAIEAETSNSRVIELVLRMDFARRFRQFDYYRRLPAEKADEMRRLIERVRARAPGSVEFLEMLAWIESAAPEPNVRNVNLVQAQIPRERLSANVVLGLAVVRARLGERESALRLLTAVEDFSPRSEEKEFARQVRRILKDPALVGED
jgi:hypothetical protein